MFGADAFSFPLSPKAAPLSIAARGGTICSTSQLVAAGKTNDCYMWTLAPDFSLCYNAVTLIG
jgi:hypothetical protein